ADATELHIAHGDVVRVESRRGSLDATALVTSTVQPGQVFVPMHYAATNRLTFPAVDPHSRQPSYKYCAVRLRPLERWEVPHGRARWPRRITVSMPLPAAPSRLRSRATVTSTRCSSDSVPFHARRSSSRLDTTAPGLARSAP